MFRWYKNQNSCFLNDGNMSQISKSAFTGSKSAMETPKQCVKSVK